MTAIQNGVIHDTVLGDTAEAHVVDVSARESRAILGLQPFTTKQTVVVAD